MPDEAKRPANPPPDWVEDWVKVKGPDSHDAAAYRSNIWGPSSMTPKDFGQPVSAPNPPSSGSGWQVQRELGPQPGIDLIDRMVENATARERAQAQQPADLERMMTVMAGMLQMQSQTLQALAAVILRDDQSRPKPKPKRAKDDRGPKAKL